MFRGAAVIVYLFLGVASLHSQEWKQRYGNHMMWAKDAFDKEQVREMLQDFVNTTYGKSYRYFADRQDFFHGHLLYADERSADNPERLKLLGVLYHTQEEASTHSKKDPGGKYDYLDRYTRSWMQFASNEKDTLGPIANALELMFDFFPDTKEYRSGLDATQNYYTVYDDQLDYRKFPAPYKTRPIGSVQYYFDPCASEEAKITQQMIWLDGGQIQIREPGATEDTCLQLRMTVSYSPVKSFDENSESLPLKNNARPDFLQFGSAGFLADSL